MNIESDENMEDAIERVKSKIASRPDSPVLQFMKRQSKLREELIEKYGPDYDKERYGFQVNKAEYEVINEWLKSLKPEILALQEQRGRTDPLGHGEPYYGATGGGVTYTFTPTSLGDILVVKEATTGKELNVSDALEWIFYG